MATKIVIQQQTEQAQRDLNDALVRLGSVAGVEVPDVRNIVYRRDPMYQEMLRWQAIADAAVRIANSIGDAAVSLPEVLESKPERQAIPKRKKHRAEQTKQAELSDDTEAIVSEDQPVDDQAVDEDTPPVEE